MSGSRTTDESLKRQKPSRTTRNKKDKKKYCKGKVGRSHNYEMRAPKRTDEDQWHCVPWDTVHRGLIWYCRHVMICTKCGRQKPADGLNCPDRPEDDGTVEIH